MNEIKSAVMLNHNLEKLEEKQSVEKIALFSRFQKKQISFNVTNEFNN